MCRTVYFVIPSVRESIAYGVADNNLLLERISEWVRGFNDSTFSKPGWSRQVVQEHEALIEAIEARRPADAERLAPAQELNARQIRLDMLGHAGEQMGEAPRAI